MTQQKQKPKETEKDSTQKVIDAAKELYELGLDVTREALKSATDLPMSIVDERIRTLIYEERMVRVERGKYEPVVSYHEQRAMSRTILADGRVKYEVGDQVIELSPREDRVLADLTGGALVKLVGVEAHRVSREANDLMLKRLENIEKMSRDRARRAAIEERVRQEAKVQQEQKKGRQQTLAGL